MAALTPKIHREIWKKWPLNLPSEDTLKHTLCLDWKPPFNPAAVDGFIKEYKDTIAFAKPDASVIVPTGGEESDDEEEVDSDEKREYTPKVGQFVQWEHNGVLGFTEPKQIREITADGSYAFVEGQVTGVPTNELILEKAPQVKPKIQPPTLPMSSLTGSKRIMQEFVVPLSDGGKAVFQWPSTLTAEDLLDLEDSLKIVGRKIKRSGSETNPDAATKAAQ